MNVSHVSVDATASKLMGVSRNNLQMEKQEIDTSRSASGKEQVSSLLPTIEELEKSAEEANKIVQTVRKNLKFNVHEETNRVFVEVRNMETNEVIKEMPPKDFLDMLGRIREFVGLLLDERI